MEATPGASSSRETPSRPPGGPDPEAPSSPPGPTSPSRRGVRARCALLAALVSVCPATGLLWPLASTWLLFVWWPMALPLWCWALRRAWRRPRRAWALAATLLLSPFVVVPGLSAARAVHDYRSGKAVLVTSWSDVYTGLDPEVRCAQRVGRDSGAELFSSGVPSS